MQQQCTMIAFRGRKLLATMHTHKYLMKLVQEAFHGSHGTEYIIGATFVALFVAILAVSAVLHMASEERATSSLLQDQQRQLT
jgi:hypothetical protein